MSCNNINLGDPIAVLGSIDSVLGSVDLETVRLMDLRIVGLVLI